IVRMEVAAADDQQILAAARDEQLAVVDEPQIAGAEIRLRVAGDARVERVARRILALPVAAGDARSPRPDLADRAGAARLLGLRIDDLDAAAIERRAAADELDRALLIASDDNAPL